MRLPLALFALLPTVALAAPQPTLTPRQIIERAIVAHGGHEKLSKARSDRVWLRGKIYAGSKAFAFSNELTLQLPAHYKSVLLVEDGDKHKAIVHLLADGKATVLVDGQPQTVTSLHLAQLRQTLQLEQAMRLVPLLQDPAFTLQPGQDFSYNGSVVTSVRVQSKGQRELVLYFDQRNGLLIKSQHRIDGPAGKEITQEAFYSDYRDVGGHRRPGKVIVQRDGKTVMEVELVDAQRVEHIDAVEFTRP